ncbi:MAG: hypothetical protein MZU97_11485 [Bacillus subtilis]|nr:hypothetical protein [Bacillus subtilis]
MKKKLLALIVVLLTLSLVGCDVRGFFDNVRFKGEAAAFAAKYGDYTAYSLHSAIDIAYAYTISGHRYTERIEMATDSVVDLADFYVDATMVVEGQSERFIVYRADGEEIAYRLVNQDRLIRTELAEEDLPFFCGCEDDVPSVGPMPISTTSSETRTAPTASPSTSAPITATGMRSGRPSPTRSASRAANSPD